MDICLVDNLYLFMPDVVLFVSSRQSMTYTISVFFVIRECGAFSI